MCGLVSIRILYFSLGGVGTGVLELRYGGTVRGPRAVFLGWLCAAAALVPFLGAVVLLANGIRLIRS
jgi:hypothetical protein